MWPSSRYITSESNKKRCSACLGHWSAVAVLTFSCIGHGTTLAVLTFPFIGHWSVVAVLALYYFDWRDMSSFFGSSLAPGCFIRRLFTSIFIVTFASAGSITFITCNFHTLLDFAHDGVSTISGPVALLLLCNSFHNYPPGVFANYPSWVLIALRP